MPNNDIAINSGIVGNKMTFDQNGNFWTMDDHLNELYRFCLLYTSDAADERSSVDLGGRRIIKKKKNVDDRTVLMNETERT